MGIALTLSLALPASPFTPPAATAEVEGPLAPSPEAPHPVGVGHFVVLNGEMTARILTNYDQGFWEVVDGDGRLVGWGTNEYDPEPGAIEYINLSGGGDGQGIQAAGLVRCED